MNAPSGSQYTAGSQVAMNVATDKAMSNSWVIINLPDGGVERIRYDQFVMRLFKVDTFNEMAHHAKGGVCEEAGELSDVIKRHITYGRQVTSEGKDIRTGLIEELGDLDFYKQAVQNLYGISEQEIKQANAEKLQKRYVDLVWSSQAAEDRKDKKA